MERDVKLVTVKCISASLAESAILAYWADDDTRNHHMNSMIDKFKELVKLMGELDDKLQ